MLRLSVRHLAEIEDLVPFTARAIVHAIGAEAACALLNDFPGALLIVPRRVGAGAGDDAGRPAQSTLWSRVVATLGEPAAGALCAWRGGEPLQIPVCQALRNELRAREIRRRYDELTASSSLSGRQAVAALCAEFAPITSRAVEKMVARGDRGESPSAQAQLSLL